jgi:hypothetical protein
MDPGMNVEVQARELGWSPKEEFKGDPERWIDAETFVKRGEELMPILKANNRKLLGEVMSLKEAVKASQDSISALKEFNSKINIREAKETKKVLVEQLKEARSDGDVETELKLTKEIDKTEKKTRYLKLGKKSTRGLGRISARPISQLLLEMSFGLTLSRVTLPGELSWTR